MQNYLRAQAKLETAWKQVSNQFLVGIISHIWFSLLSTKNIFLWQLYQITYISGFGIQTWDNLDHRGNYASAVISFEKTFLPNRRPCLFLPLTWSFREGIHNHCRSCVVSSCALGKWNPLFQENFFQNFCSWGNCLAQLSGALHDSFYKNFCSGKLFDPALWRESCPIGDCPWACGARLHMCKVFDNSYFLLRLQKNWTFENKFSIFSALTPIALTSKLTPGQRPRRNLPELPTTWRPRLAAPPWWTWSTRSRGGRWGRRPGTKSALRVCWG